MEPFTFDRIDYENRLKVRFSFCFKVRFSSYVFYVSSVFFYVSSVFFYVSSVFLLVHTSHFTIKLRFYEMKMGFPGGANSAMGFGFDFDRNCIENRLKAIEFRWGIL
jgi:hypothetical protein